MNLVLTIVFTTTQLFDGKPKDVLDQIFSIGEKFPVKHIGEPEELAEAYLFAMKYVRAIQV